MKFLVFSDDWGEHPSSCQHLFQILTHNHPTIWVNTVGLRLPQLTFNDTVKGVRKLSAMLGLRQPYQPNGMNGHSPHVFSPLMTPFHRPQWMASWNQSSLQRQLTTKLRKHAFDDFTIITTTPSVCDVVGELKAKKIIYYCVDDFSEWPGMEKKLILDLEERLLAHVSTVICTSQTLYDKFQTKYPTHLLRHGVDVQLFSNLPPQEHEKLRGIPNPRVGYFGNFDKRNSQELLTGLAKAMPYVSFVFTGPVQDNIAAFRQLPNVHFTGPVPYEELPAIVRGWDACLLPYRYNALTMNINPLKLKEYLACGKPVIATPLPDVCELGQYLRVVDEKNIGGWRAAIDDAISGQWVPDLTAIGHMLAGESWERKADIFLRICQVA